MIPTPPEDFKTFDLALQPRPLSFSPPFLSMWAMRGNSWVKNAAVESR